MRRISLWLLGALLAGAALALAGCSGTTEVLLPPAATTTAVATATTTLPAPGVPAGWQQYTGPHFTLAFSPGWTAQATPQGDSTATQPDIVYSFAPSGADTPSVSVTEQDGWDAATTQNVCTMHANDQMVTLAGMQWHYVLAANGQARVWYFFSNQGTAYTLMAYDATANARTQAQDDAILATFHADYATSGCA